MGLIERFCGLNSRPCFYCCLSRFLPPINTVKLDRPPPERLVWAHKVELIVYGLCISDCYVNELWVSAVPAVEKLGLFANTEAGEYFPE